MSSSEEYLASLGLDTSDVDNAVQQTITLLGHLGNQFEGISKQTGAAERSLLKASTSAKAAGKGIKEASGSAADGTTEWKKYSQALSDANSAYREFRRGQVTGEGGGADIPATRDARDNLLQTDAAQRAGIISAINEQDRAEKKAIKEREQEETRVAALVENLRRQGTARAIQESEREKNARIADMQAISAAYVKQQSRDNLGQSNARYVPGAGAGLSAEQNAAMSAAYGRTTTRAAENVRSLVDEQEKLNQVVDRGASDNLPRLRYALYDVSNVVGIVGLSFAAMTAGIVGTSIAFEREFANVRRTTGVTGDAAQDLYQDFLQLSTEIPVAFRDLSEIGTLAGQLGVVENRVEAFTSTVAKFSATTDVSVDKSATAFGRLDQLIDGVDGKYQNLGSSILNVGINSVATESDIISIASQIAATGNQAGLTADEIIGLSGSLASLGVAPEAARGTVLRVFGKINSAVSSGGEALDNFSRISSMSSRDFENSWGKPGGFTKVFLDFLDGVNAKGIGAEEAIRGLGITAARDVNALLKLSQNTEAVAKNLDLAAIGFESGAILADNFGIIADTTGAKLQVLGQTFQAFIATLGQSSTGPLTGLIELTTDLLKVFTALTSTPVGQFFALLTVGGTALIAVMALIAAAALRGAGSFLALKTAIGEVALTTAVADKGLKGFGATLLGAAGASKAFGAALASTVVGAAITAGLFLIAGAVTEISAAMAPAEERARSYFGTLEGLSEAIKQDNTAIFTEQAASAKAAIDGAATSSDHWITVLENAALAQQNLTGSTGGSSAAIDEQTLSIGENTQQWILNTLASNESFRAIFSNLESLKALQSTSMSLGGQDVTGFEAFDMTAFADALANGGVGAGEKYIENFKTGLIEAAQSTGDVDVLNAAEGFLVTNEALAKAEEAGRAISDALKAGLDEAAQASAISEIMAGLGQVEDAGEDAGDTFRQLTEDIFGVINAEQQLNSDLGALGAAFVENGSAVAVNGSQMQAVIASIYASSSGAPEAAARMQGLFDALVRGGYASASQLAELQAVIAGLAGGKSVRAVQFNMAAFADGTERAMAKATKAVAGRSGNGSGGAAKAVRTLVDYSNDLAKVFKRSFEIRFGGMQGADQIAGTWNGIRQTIADANKTIQEAIEQTNEKMRDYRNEMQSLSSDRAVTAYWLSVAEAYRDTLRAGELRSELAEIDTKLEKTSKDLAETQTKGNETVAAAQEKTNKTLVGNSEVAIENRAEILNLVGSYESYIAQLAASGMSQADLRVKSAQLKQEFIAQATQMGYSRAEVMKYASAFDDMRVAIDRIPRNITVSANTNPAIQAMNEYNAAIDRVRQNSAGAIDGPAIRNPTVSKEIRRMALEAAILANSAWVAQLGREGNGRGAVSAADYGMRLKEQLRLEQYRKGGWTGGGNPWDEAGIVHKKEFVLNERGAQMLPMSVLNAMNQGRAPVMPTAPRASSANNARMMVVEFSAQDRALIAEAGNRPVVISGVGIQQATNMNNMSDSVRGGA